MDHKRRRRAPGPRADVNLLVYLLLYYPTQRRVAGRATMRPRTD